MSARRPALWPVALVGVLAVTVIANVALLRLASDPDAGALEPDAYARAVAWDSLAAERDASRELGWSAVASLEPAGEHAAIRVRLRDRGGEPVSGALVRVEAIRNGRARRFTSTLAPGPGEPGGTYVAMMPMAGPGLWELRLRADRGAERFTVSLRLELEGATP